MLLAPKPGQLYRDPATLQLVPDAGMEFDPADLDVARALDCGDLVPVPTKRAPKAPSPE